MGFNVVKGWPLGSGLEDSAIPAPGVTIEAGMFLKRDVHPTLANTTVVRPIDIAGAADVRTNTYQPLFALDRSAAFDVIESNRIPFLLQNAIVETDQLGVGATFTAANIGEVVVMSLTEPGMVVDLATHGGAVGNANCIVVGIFDGLTTIADINGDEQDGIRIILGTVHA